MDRSQSGILRRDLATVEKVDLERPGRFVYFRVTQKSSTANGRTWTAPVWLESAK